MHHQIMEIIQVTHHHKLLTLQLETKLLPLTKQQEVIKLHNQLLMVRQTILITILVLTWMSTLIQKNTLTVGINLTQK